MNRLTIASVALLGVAVLLIPSAAYVGGLAARASSVPLARSLSLHPAGLVGPTNSSGTPPKNWTQIILPVAPGARAEDVMAFDPVDGYFVMFGGHNRLSLLGDTWKFTTAGKWVRLHLTPTPQPRRGAMMTYDPADGYLMMFGGSNNTNYLNDTWKFVGGKWTQLAPTVSPPARRVAGITYDSLTSEVVMFGGHGGSLVPPTSFHFYNDTWTFHAGVWSQLKTPVAPTPRGEPMVAYDALDQYVLLFGGYASRPTFGDTWVLRGSAWTNITSNLTVAPISRDGGLMAYDPNGSGVVLFGGHHRTHVYNDTWWYYSGHWTQVFPSTSPRPINAISLAWNSAADYGVTFGGRWSHGWLNETWVLRP
ncbi:MAG: kelch motif-containing protein [Thermoplasmata archaeon]|nr:kelch motif-containing protein [Thermoplasmata archaeon]